MTSPLLVFVHGWAFDRLFWTPLRKLLPYDSVSIDLGFHGNPLFPDLPTDRPLIAIGHSVGVLWLLTEQPFVWDRFVSINGFSKFSRSETFPCGIPLHVLDSMLAGLLDEPSDTIKAFFTRCGLKDISLDSIDIIRLRTGLYWLRDEDARKIEPGPMIALAGRNDPIVTPAITENCFNHILWHEGGHLLPLTATNWCADHICQFIETV